MRAGTRPPDLKSTIGPLAGRRIHLCVTGGVAAYKGVGLARALIKAGATVQVAMTQGAQAFVTPLSFQAVTHMRVLTRTLDPSEEMGIGHIDFAQKCDAILVAPATANTIGKAAHGIGDEVVATVLLAATVPVIVAPAMNTAMLHNPAVQANLAQLSARGWTVVEPDEGHLACGAVGRGRLPDPEIIVDAVVQALAPHPQPLLNRHVVVSAGPTREYLDPVRFLSNPSSGKTGFAIAAAAARAGARVTLVHGPVALTPPPQVEAVPIVSARDMHAAVLAASEDADAVVMSAAVADWRPAESHEQKQKKTTAPLTVTFARNPDILADLGAARRDRGRGPVLVGFAAETGDPRASAESKRSRKGVDLIVANDVSAPECGFETESNRVWLVADTIEALPLMPKTDIADRIVSWIATALEAR